MIGLGFIAIVAGYTAVALAVLYVVTEVATTTRAKTAAALVCVLAFLGLAFGDELYGYFYMRHLCSTEGGVRIYKTVTLDPQNWNADGSPRFFSSKAGDSFKPFLDGRYEIQAWGRTELKWPELVRSEFAVLDRQTKEPLAAYVSFSVGRGWMLTATGAYVGGWSCPGASEDIDATLIGSAFRKRS